MVVLIVIALTCVVLSLMIGVISMAKGGEFNAKYGNLLMRARIISQGIAVVLLLIMMMTA
ncbi:MAG: HIG1 domain-containing protein [Rhodospirillaceae bacterium]|jgi:hypothetical protein|nr:HIG1 domain-containing protein [Rhodospirillaceae bacterium]MBT7488331.1 HIG1 domain-containing protein [Rhodospirillales bacterium]MBT4702018.1 HIG1 domain-containing protein [Rhodospirillaceae bacterium]MBT5034734.1 HIG1 domain-containing protein [Rhodospirillaceae bacterium]MBT6221465.1 HIG1 domain-containing protein [Rhodospirillaceae bacterium]